MKVQLHPTPVGAVNGTSTDAISEPYRTAVAAISGRAELMAEVVNAVKNAGAHTLASRVRS